jgi:hypothetical protein
MAPADNPWTGVACPTTKPTEGSACERAGMKCGYGVPLEDHVCTAELRWRTRRFEVPPDAGFEEDFEIEQPAQISCYSDGPSCPASSKQCVVRCCAGGAGEGCAGCCQPQFCEALPATECPAERCRLRRGCNGAVVCTTPVSPPPVCATPGGYGATCCEGLVESCNVRSTGDGSCMEGVGRNGLPVCFACGDGLCELGENDCSCPADCP